MKRITAAITKQEYKNKFNDKSRSIFYQIELGFTLIELLVVCGIIGILATFSLFNYMGVKMRARDTQRKSDFNQLRSALELYRADIGAYPNALPNCGSALTSGTTTYIQKIPCDPLNVSPNIYTYTPGVGLTSYSLMACLENNKDSQKDSPNNNVCTGSSASYTVMNP